MTNSYALVGPKLVDMGYSAIPCMPGSKRPGTYSRGHWYGDLDWTRFCERLPTELETEAWSKYPDGGVCIALGKASGGLVAIDVDTDRHEVIEAIKGAIPDESPIQKMGRKGFTAFYRARPAVVSCAFNINGERALDLLAHGKQTVIPPTIHPDSGRPYVWLTESTLEHISTDRLPMLPDDIAARLGEALSPFGYYAPVERPASSEGGGLWREINDVALERFEDWLPHLGIEAKRLRNGTWRGKAIWKGAENANVGFAPTGIKDWGDDRGMTAIDVVMEAHAADFSTAEKWLRERLGIEEPPPVRFIFRKAEPDLEPDAPQEPPPLGTPEIKVDPFDHKFAGGLLQTTAEWIMSTSFVPSRELSLIAAIGIVAAFISRRYVSDATGLAPNLYLIGLASTGSGKDAPLRAVKSLFTRHGGMDHFLGGGDFSSDAAIEQLVRAQPCVICPMDEIGAWLQEGSARNSSQHSKNRRKILLELYASSQVGGIYIGKNKAMQKREEMSSTLPVYSPCFSILGMSTPDLFFRGLTEENMSDGLLNRLTVIHIPPCNVVSLRVPGNNAALPPALKQAFDQSGDAWPGAASKLSRAYRNGATDPFVHRVPWADEAAERRWRQVWEWQEELIRDATQSEGLVKRVAEQTMKLALIRAVSRDFAAPTITVADVEFGYAIVFQSVNMLADGIKRYMSGSDFEDNCKLILRAVEKEPLGLTKTQLTRRAGIGKIKDRDLNEVLKYLTENGRWRAEKTGNRRLPLFPWRRRGKNPSLSDKKISKSLRLPH